MKQNRRKRGIALLLTACLIRNAVLPAAAAELKAAGLCEHHTSHTADCGYSEGTAGTPCTHEHRGSGGEAGGEDVQEDTENCYKEVTKCVHVHTEDCYPEGLILDEDATPSDAENLEPTECTHMCSGENGCVTEELDCLHEHDEVCGYTKAVEGHPCGYVCAECAAKEETGSGTTSEKEKESCICTERCGAKKGNEDCPVCMEDAENCAVQKEAGALVIEISGWEWVDPDGNLADGIIALPGVEEGHQSSFEDIAALLPAALTGTVEGEDEPVTAEITGWVCESYTRDGNGGMADDVEAVDDVKSESADSPGIWPVSGEYVFAAVLAEGYTAAPAPVVTVKLGGANLLTDTGTGDFTVKGGKVNTDYTYENNTLAVLTDESITISGRTTQDKIVVGNGVEANITLEDVDIQFNDGTDNGNPGTCAFDMAGATVNLRLVGKNTLISGFSKAGLHVPVRAALVIEAASTGSLTAKCTKGGGAGIGGGTGEAGGTITIDGGIISASATGRGAGIGGGDEGTDGGAITITGGMVDASSDYGAGIGGGSFGAGGTISISGGTVIANSGYYSAGIGGSVNKAGGTINISGGKVTANGGKEGAGIGGGSEGDSGRITISGGEVTANGGNRGAGIGSGKDGSSKDGSITISGGKVTANGGDSAAGIGGGRGDMKGTITITGGTVMAAGGTSAAGIGGGFHGTGGAISIANAVVFATSDILGEAEHIGNGGFNDGSNDGETQLTIENSLVVQGNNGEVTGNASITDELILENEMTLVIPEDSDLTIEGGAILTNYGTITGNGTIHNNGTINDISGNINVNVTGTGVNKPSEVQITFQNSSHEVITEAAYGDTITITAAAGERGAGVPGRNASKNRVDFYVGEIAEDKKLGTAEVSANRAVLTVMLSGSDWSKGFVIGENPIVSDFGGTTGLLDSTATATLRIGKADRPAPAAPTQNGAATDTAVTLNAVSGQKYQYTTDITPPAADADGWQTADGDTCQFTGLKHDTDYYFWTYIPENGYYNNSLVSEAVKIRTDKSDDQKAVEAAKAAVENVPDWTVAQAAVNSEQSVKVWIADKINDLEGMGATGITVAEGGVMVNSFLEATAGTADDRDGTAGSFTFTVRLEKGGAAAGTDEKTGTITATRYTKPAITTASLTDGVLGESYSQTLSAAGDGTVTWSIMAGRLPAGLTLNETTGVISGTPERAGTFSFTVRAENGSGNDSRELSIAVPAAVPVVQWPDASLTYGQTLGSAVLKGGSAAGIGGETVDGTFLWKTEHTAPAVSDSQTTVYEMIFTPTGSNRENYTAASNQDMTVTVEPKPLTLSLTADPSPGTAKQDVTLTATLSGTVENALPSGTVTFKRDGVIIQSGAAISERSGTVTASATWSGVPGGIYNLTAEYIPAALDNYKGRNPAELDRYTVNKANPLAGKLTITGTPKNGVTLTASLTESNNTGSLTYRWLYNGAELAAGESYTLKTSDVGHQLTVEVTSSVQSGAVSRLTDTVQPRSTGSGSSGSGDNDDSYSVGSHVTVQPSDPAKPDAPATGVITIDKPDKDGNAEIPIGQVTDAIDKATTDAQKNGTGRNGVAVAVSLPAGTVSATLNRAALNKLIVSGATSFQLNFGGVSMNFDLAALKEIAAQTTGTLTFGAAKASSLTGDAQTAIGERPAYALSVTGQKDDKLVTVTSFGAGRVTLAIAYTPAENEHTGALYLVRAEQDGSAVWHYQSGYEVSARRLTGSASHLGIYGVGYTLIHGTGKKPVAVHSFLLCRC